MDFEFGQTAQSVAFLERNPKCEASLDKLGALSNKCFGPEVRTMNRMESISYCLGFTCREDFLEILFLAVNGFGSGALKLLRGLYERTVALAYIIKRPEKAERFIRFAAIQEYKALVAAGTIVTDEQFDAVIGETTTAAQIRASYQEVRAEFQVTRCRECGDQGTAFSWDIDVASMVHVVGDPLKRYYLGAYTIPNFHIHATLASVYDGQPEDERTRRRQSESDFAVANASGLFLEVMKSQNTLFTRNLDEEISACDDDLMDVWVNR